jgi:acetoin utilization deacetylase AcuC-like enzyme
MHIPRVMQEVRLPDGHRFPMDKYRKTRQQLQDDKFVSSKIAMYPSPSCDLDVLRRVHCPAYVQRFLIGSLLPQDTRAIGFPWTPSIVARNLAFVGGVDDSVEHTWTTVSHSQH